MKTNWHGLITILEIQHRTADGTVLWEAKKLKNVLHTKGEEYMLNALFLGGKTSNTYIPLNYYLGLDNRVSLSVGQTFANITGEPTGNGYVRKDVSSTATFEVSVESGVYVAKSPTLSFSATGGNWGPVRNLFLSTTADNSGCLVASVPLSAATTVLDTQSIFMRFVLSLQDIP